MRTHRTHTTKRIPTSDATAQHRMACITAADDNETFLRDDSDLLLFAASALLSRHAPSSDDDCVALPPSVDFSSFQALLKAATSAVTTEPAARDAGSEVKASPTRLYARTAQAPTTALPSSYAKKRRERNRLSCRKTRLKRKVEQARALLIVRKRDEHNEYLSALHREVATREFETREKARLARHLVVRSLHFALMDPAYDASWCVAVPTRPTADDVRNDMAAQWQAIAAAFAVADLSILQIHDDRPHEVACMWCASGTPTFTEQFQDDNDNDDSGGGHQPAWRSVTGTTRVRFHGQLVASVEMRVADCGAFAVAV